MQQERADAVTLCALPVVIDTSCLQARQFSSLIVLPLILQMQALDSSTFFTAVVGKPLYSTNDYYSLICDPQASPGGF